MCVHFIKLKDYVTLDLILFQLFKGATACILNHKYYMVKGETGFFSKATGTICWKI